MKKSLLKQLFIVIILLQFFTLRAQEKLFTFGEEMETDHLFQEKDVISEPIQWIQVNTEKNTWEINSENELNCTGNPIGVIRTEKKYENFMLHIEWKHMEPGGNSGVFVWSDAVPQKRLPNGVEIQMLELDWVNQARSEGRDAPIAYVHGEVFGVGGVEIIPDNPRGKRSKSKENRCKGKGEWNTYDVVCVDGTIKLAVNGKFVNGISKSSKREGYLCLESEGAEIHFRNIIIMELP